MNYEKNIDSLIKTKSNKLEELKEVLASYYRYFGANALNECPTNCHECIFKEVEKRKFRNLTWNNRSLIKQGLEPVKLRHYLGRQQFYRQNGLPAELNFLIEKEIKQAYQGIRRQRTAYEIVEDKKDDYEQECLNNIVIARQELKDFETKQQKAEEEKEIQRILKKEIEDFKWQVYLNIKPLPELPQRQNQIKKLGNKIKTQFQQVVKPQGFPKPIKSNLPNLLAFFLC